MIECDLKYRKHQAVHLFIKAWERVFQEEESGHYCQVIPVDQPNKNQGVELWGFSIKEATDDLGENRFRGVVV